MDKADESKVKKQEVNAILQEGIDFYIDYNRPNILRRKGILPTSKKFIVKPIVLGALMRISKIMVDMDLTEKINRDDFFVKGVEIMSEHINGLLDIVALAIHNGEGNPPKSIKRLFRRNCTPEELMTIITFVISQMDVSNFMKSIISIKGVSLLETKE